MDSISNKDVVKTLKQLSGLLELHQKEDHKIKAINNATFNLERLNYTLASKKGDDIAAIQGIGKSLAQDINHILETGTHPMLVSLEAETPKGVLKISELKGIGAKKVRSLWKDLGILSMEALKLACNENKVSKLKGFGAKTEENILQQIAFINQHIGSVHLNQAMEVAQELLPLIQAICNNAAITGAIRRRASTLDKIEIIAAGTDAKKMEELITSSNSFELQPSTCGPFTTRAIHVTSQVSVHIHLCSEPSFYNEWMRTTARARHLYGVKKEGLTLQKLLKQNTFSSEEAMYEALEFPYIEPELREGSFELNYSKESPPPQLLKLTDLKGPLHNHSTYSDGVNTLEDMAVWCKEQGYEYLGISDHSQSAFFYANGLFEENIIEQHKEIDALNKELAPFKIFKGIESDILADGSLDYSKDVLERFDFIVASIHSGMKMEIEKATERLITAISNPYTTILGHPTGRLLLKRAGYPIDHKKVIDACAQYNVAIEINSNPWRLDMDWTWVHYALEKGVVLSINPDAHIIKGFDDMQFGVMTGRKGGLTPAQTMNAWSGSDLEAYFEKRKSSIS